MNTASVGFHCPQCAHQGRQQVHTRQTMAARRDPIVTKVLIGINAVVFVLTSLSGGGIGRPGGQLYIDGVLIGIARSGQGFDLIGVDAGEWYRLVTGGFLHANLIHIGFNMYLLYMLGSVLEPALGRMRFGLLYGTSLLAGSFGVMLIDPTAPTVGASGAVFGLMGAMVVAQRATGINPWQSGIGGLLAINLVLTFAISNISIGGHIGGLVGGAIAGALLVELPARLRGTDRRTVELASSALVVVFGAACVAGSLWAASHWYDPILG
ncbi:MAG: rhomboid family intramembrane serine protease [Acidimicrobiia bacterium]|nr:rhomboid family intramembrane serine protease [Acidimicrobiia bacterium]